jgi:site-specific DNA recombinase
MLCTNRGEQPKQAVLRARVSSKEQEEEGFSLPAQIRPLQEYAARNGIVIVREFVDVESANTGGRAGFNEMVAYLKKHHTTCRTILVEKTDRLYRNIKDWATLDELGVTIHFVKENVVIGPESRSNDQFVHGIKVLMARNYSLNLGEETTKGMLEKARAGIYPSFAPVGYRNTDGPAGKRVIVPDSDTATVITELFGCFATGSFSIKALVAKLRAEGITLRGRRLCSSTAHQILRKRLYMGDFDWDGTTYQGTHEPLVTRECWERVQTLLDARAETKTRKVKHDFAFTGLVRCDHCGCLLVGELKCSSQDLI